MLLYRGENILNGKPERIRLFKNFLRHGLPLDFINGGNPYRVQQLGLFDATVSHVARNSLGTGSNGLKHFISFSQEKEQAEYYATRYFEGNFLKENAYELFDEHYSPDLNSYRDDHIWAQTQHLLIELDISNAQSIDAQTPFVKILSFNGGANRILALDVVAYLTLQIQRIGQPSSQLLQQFPNVLPELQTALGYATTDTEWLITSLDPIPPQNGVPPSFSAIIPHSDILEVKHHLGTD